MLSGLMQETPLELRLILARARDLFPRKTVTTRLASGLATATYTELIERAGRLASSLSRELGIRVGDRVGSLAWNSQANLEIALAVPGMSAVLHTINARLDPASIGALVAEAADQVVFVDAALLDLWRQVEVPACVRAVVIVDERETSSHPVAGASPRQWAYESLVAAGEADFRWPSVPESSALGLCFTSGTTGRPKGVLYSHRSTVLHALTMLMADGIALRERDVCLPIVQQFHANGWGFPYASLLAGASLAFAGKASDPQTLADIIERAGVTVATAVPTVWAGLLDAVETGRIDRRRLASLNRLPVGGAVASQKLIQGYARMGIRVLHCWGMTEISPLGTVNGGPKSTLLAPADQQASTLSQGLTLPLCATRIVDDEGTVLPCDGRAIGELQITGPWVARAYYNSKAPSCGQPASVAFFTDLTGTTWLRTGDLATIDVEGYVRLVDRAKDLIKSGGEWISSVALEVALLDQPGVLEAAVIGRPHPKWDERPVAYIVASHDSVAIEDEITKNLARRFAKWQLPDAIVVVRELPKGATGKVDKRALRIADARIQSADGGARR